MSTQNLKKETEKFWQSCMHWWKIGTAQFPRKNNWNWETHLYEKDNEIEALTNTIKELDKKVKRLQILVTLMI